MNENDRYLLTGASGFLGSIIYKKLTENGITVTKLKADITSTFNLDDTLNINVVIHAAGKAHIVPKTPQQRKLFYDVNFEGTKNLCRALEKLPVKPNAFIFISTVSVYGVDSGTMISEDHLLKGETPYAESKIMAEKWLQDWAKENNITLGILRLPLVAGLNPPGNLGDMIKGIHSGKYFSIGKANAKKSMVWGEDIVSVFSKLSEIGGTYNLTDGIHPTFKQLELVIANKAKKHLKTLPLFVVKGVALTGDILGSKFPVNSNKLKKIITTLTFDDAKARNILGWKPSSVLEKLQENL